jgi:predicted O-methyltransferase YrrM
VAKETMKTIIADIPSRDEFFKGLGILERDIPWLSFGAIIALESVLSPEMSVLELGSGGSTLFFANHCRIVFSIETDQKWEKKMQEHIRAYNNAQVAFRTQETAIITMNSFQKGEFDVVLIDTGWINGEVRHKPDRLKLALAAAPLVRKGGYLILDNYEKYGLSKFPTAGWKVYTFDDFGYSGRGTRILKKL